MTTRRQCLAILLLSGPWTIASGQISLLDSIAVYIVPLDDFPEDAASALARFLQQQLGIRIKASLKLPPLGLSALPGTNQYAVEDILAQGAAASSSLPETSPRTYRLFLTTRDINNRTANFRFQISSHNPGSNCSVLSVARLLEYPNNKSLFTNLSASRLVKMAKRAIGEMTLGWTRTTNPTDLMYAPIMSIDDLDRIGYEHNPNPNVNPPTSTLREDAA